MARVGGGILRRDIVGCVGALRQAGDIQYRSELAVHRAAFTGSLASNGIAISMDGKRALRDDVFVERFWRSVKYEELYLRAYDSVGQPRSSIAGYFDSYNSRRPTPDQTYPLPTRMAA